MPSASGTRIKKIIGMKKTTLLIIGLLASASAFAEGYQVNALSAKQTGMGHTGTAMKLGSESIHFNPAALSFQQNRFDVSLGMSGIITDVDFSSATASAKSDNKLATPLYAYFSWRPTDRLAFGVGFTTPYGSSMNWGDNWAGAHLVQNISLKSYCLQPTVSYRLFDRLSVGVGVMIAIGNVDLSRALLPVGTGSSYIAAQMSAAADKYSAASDLYAAAGNAVAAAEYEAMAVQARQGAAYIGSITDHPLVSVNIEGRSRVAAGVNVGIMYDIGERWTVGLTYRSKMRMKVGDGTAALSYYDAGVETVLGQLNAASIAAGGAAVVPALDRGTFRTELPLPSNTTLGVSFRPTSRWEFAVDFQLVGWHAYKDLTLKFNEPELEIDDIYSVKNYKNTLITRVGAECGVTDWLALRTGLYVDRSPVRSDYLNPETPSMTKVSYSVGGSVKLARPLTLDFSYVYITSADPERTGSYPYEIAGQSMPFSGNYRIDAHIFSIGCSLSF